MNNSRVPTEGEAVVYYVAGPGGFTLARLAYVTKVHDAKSPATLLDLRVLSLDDGYPARDVPYGHNSFGHWGWGG